MSFCVDLKTVLDESIASMFRVEGYWRRVRERERVFWPVDEVSFSPEL